jgi:hypothetical protein
VKQVVADAADEEDGVGGGGIADADEQSDDSARDVGPDGGKVRELASGVGVGAGGPWRGRRRAA